MNLPVRFLREARSEFRDAVEWYEDRQVGLGLTFISRVRDVLNSVSADSERHAVVYLDVRKAVVRNFPYVVLYRADGAEILIVSIFHTSREPRAWKSRLSQDSES